MAKKKKEKRAVGWKEHVALPDLKIKSVIAKIDTGANVATIDAANIKFITKNDIKYVKFTVETIQLEKPLHHLQDLKE